MCVESAYYDTCVFLESLNERHPEHDACRDVVDVRRISWAVVLSPGLSSAEASIGEYLDRFEIECVGQGVTVRAMSRAAGQAVEGRHRALKRVLRQRGFSGKDWQHLMAATAAEAEVLLTTDPDYWDPHNKAQPGARKQSDRVKRLIEADLPLRVRLPSEIRSACCG
jgi:hypothetical protein